MLVSAELSSAALESLVPSSSVVETTEEVPVVEVSLVELLLLPLQAAMLRASIKTITEAMIFFIFSFPFNLENLLQVSFQNGRLPFASRQSVTRIFNDTECKSNLLQRNHRILYEFLTNDSIIMNNVSIIELCNHTISPVYFRQLLHVTISNKT